MCFFQGRRIQFCEVHKVIFRELNKANILLLQLIDTWLFWNLHLSLNFEKHNVIFGLLRLKFLSLNNQSHPVYSQLLHSNFAIFQNKRVSINKDELKSTSKAIETVHNLCCNENKGASELVAELSTLYQCIRWAESFNCWKENVV